MATRRGAERGAAREERDRLDAGGATGMGIDLGWLDAISLTRDVMRARTGGSI